MKPQSPRRENPDIRPSALPTLAITLITLVGGAFQAGVARAQQPQQQAPLEEIVVTGSRIVRRDFEANSPITTVDRAMLDNTMSVGIEKVMNQLPQFVPAVNQFVTTDVQSTATNTPGASTLSLRRRGRIAIRVARRAPRDAGECFGRRGHQHDPLGRPRARRDDHGRSVLGVRSRRDGRRRELHPEEELRRRRLDARYGTTMEGGGDETRVTGLFGANFAGGTGNVMMGFEYDQRDKVLQADRSFFRNGRSDPNTGASFFGIAEPFYQVQGGNAPNPAVVAAQFPGATRPILGGPGQNFYWNYSNNTLYKGTADGSYNYKGPLIVDGLQYREIRTDTSPGAPAAGTIVRTRSRDSHRFRSHATRSSAAAT